jgi:hypothetical protein
LVGFRAAYRHREPPFIKGQVLNVECCELHAPERAGEPEEQDHAVARDLEVAPADPEEGEAQEVER